MHVRQMIARVGAGNGLVAPADQRIRARPGLSGHPPFTRAADWVKPPDARRGNIVAAAYIREPRRGEDMSELSGNDRIDDISPGDIIAVARGPAGERHHKVVFKDFADARYLVTLEGDYGETFQLELTPGTTVKRSLGKGPRAGLSRSNAAKVLGTQRGSRISRCGRQVLVRVLMTKLPRKERGLRYNGRTSPRRADRAPGRCRAGGGLAWR